MTTLREMAGALKDVALVIGWAFAIVGLIAVGQFLLQIVAG